MEEQEVSGAPAAPSGSRGSAPEPDVLEWRDVVGFEGLYEVSNMGNVRSKDRVTPCINAGRPRTQRFVGRNLRATPDSCGYPSVNLSMSGSSSRNSVHRLVCEAFHGPRPEGQQVAHRNGIRADVRAANLKWATTLENNRHKAVHKEGGIV